jgi:hypothetical protein
MDSSRELRAMIMASFPCPPLPMQGREPFLNSHDMIAYLIDVAARRNVPSENDIRQKLQLSLTEDYIKKIQECKTEEEAWNMMTNFTRYYMMTYHEGMHETRFLPYDAITPPLKTQICSWLAAQYIIQGQSEVTSDQFQNLSVSILYKKCRDVFCEAKDVSRIDINSCNVQNGGSLFVDVNETTKTDKSET